MVQYCVNSLLSLSSTSISLEVGECVVPTLGETYCILYWVHCVLHTDGIQLCCKPKPWTPGGKATRIKPSCLFYGTYFIWKETVWYIIVHWPLLWSPTFLFQDQQAATDGEYCHSGWYYTPISWPYSCSPCKRVPSLHRCQWCNTVYSRKKSTSFISCGNIRTTLLFCSLQSS